jgi:hypothetical protein
MKNLILIILCHCSALGLLSAQTTQATLQRTSGLVITVYAKPTSTINAGSNVNVLFAVSLPNNGPASVTGASLIGGNITAAPTETIGGRKCYPFAIETLSSTGPLTANVDNPIATITFPTSESGDVVQLNDFTESGTTNVYWYISTFGNDITDYATKFYGTNAVNGGDSWVDANLPLPVSLVSFRAEKFQDRSTSLNWTTVSEINSSHFLVQRSADKKSWTTIGRVSAAGNSQFIENYQFIDENVYNGLDSRLDVYYRLQMVDLDGQQKNSPIENVNFGKDGSKSSELALLVYPNPATDGVQVEWNGQNSVQPTLLELYDITGKLVLTQKVSENANQEYIDFGAAKMSTGLYLLRILNGSEPIAHQQIVVGQAR